MSTAYAVDSCHFLFAQPGASKFVHRTSLHGDGLLEVLFDHQNIKKQADHLVRHTSEVELLVYDKKREGKFPWLKLLRNSHRRSKYSSADWIEYARLAGDEVIDLRKEEGAVEMDVGNSGFAYKIKLANSKIYYLKKEVLETLFVNEISKILGVDFCSHAKVGYSPDGLFGVISDEVPGVMFSEFSGQIQEDSLVNAMAMSYLLGLRDSNYSNFKIDQMGVIRGYDFEPVNGRIFEDLAVKNMVNGYESIWSFNLVLPPRYNPTFIQKLKILTPSEIIKRWGNLFSSDEILWLLLRPEIILQDSENPRTP